jgi:hypothetical protein
MITGMLAWSICVGLLLLTIACQRTWWKPLQALKCRDVAVFIPSWMFFAPYPRTTDTRVLWRERLIGGSVGAWHELLPPVGGVLRAVWNPAKRERKLLNDIESSVLRMALDHPNSEYTLISLPYLIMLHRVMSLPASPLVCARQFLVIQTKNEGTGEGEIRPLFASHWHALGNGPGGAAKGASTTKTAARQGPAATIESQP